MIPIPKNRFVLFAIAVVVIMIVGCFAAVTLRHSNWDTFGNDALRQGHTSVFSSPIENKILWKTYSTGNWDQYMGAVVHDGVVYISGKDPVGRSRVPETNEHTNGLGTTYALKLDTGERIWTYPTGGSDDTATYYKGNLFVQTSSARGSGVDLSVNDYLYCFNADNGDLTWQFATPKHDPCTGGGTPAIDTVNNNVITVNQGFVYAVDIGSGDEIWNRRVVQLSTLANTASSPTYYRGNIYLPVRDASTEHTAGDFICLDAGTGNTVWVDSTCDYWDASPVIVDDVVYIAGRNREGSYLQAFNPYSGDVIWRTPDIGSIWTSASYDPSTGYMFVGGGAGIMYAYDTDGNQKWAFHVGNDIYSSPAIANGYMYFGSLNHYVYCLKTSNGELVWKHELPATIFGQPAIADGILLIACDDWHFYAFGNTDEFNTKMSIPFFTDFMEWIGI